MKRQKSNQLDRNKNMLRKSFLKLTNTVDCRQRERSDGAKFLIRPQGTLYSETVPSPCKLRGKT